MLYSLMPPHTPYKTLKSLPCKSLIFECDWELYPIFLVSEVALWCLAGWGVGTGDKNTSHFWGVFRCDLPRGRTQMTTPERCTKRVKDLTDRIVRTYVYPMAYGGFSDVWSCLLRYEQSPSKRVAVKAIRPIIANDEEFQLKQKAVEQELNVWSGLEHRNIVPLYGTTTGFGPLPAFVCPWADNGTLSDYLEKFETQLDMKKRMTLLSDIADGLDYLHSRNIIHGDLSGSNILIMKSGRACLSDFGLSKLFERVSDIMASGICFPGNIRWAAPELFDKGEGSPQSQLSSQQADVYSFGSIMLQTLSGKLPFHGTRRVAQIVIMISRGSQPPREPGWDGEAIPDVLWKFMERCWTSPDERPTSKEIVSFIKSQRSILR